MSPLLLSNVFCFVAALVSVSRASPLTLISSSLRVIVFISYFGFLIVGAVTLFYMHDKGHIDLANMYGRPRDELIQEELERLERRREKEKTAWERR